MMNTKICDTFPNCIPRNCLKIISKKEFQVWDNELTGKSEIVEHGGTLNILTKT